MSNRLQMLKQLKRFQISTTFNHGNRLMATSSNKDVVPTEFNDVETHTGQVICYFCYITKMNKIYIGRLLKRTIIVYPDSLVIKRRR